MRAFTFSGLPSRVVFGAGSIDRLENELDALGLHKALVLCTPQQEALAEGIAKSLGERCSGVYAGAVMHVPIESAVAAREEARRRDADCIVAAGGGSTTGLGKAIALDSELPLIAVPTTYAGSEMTPIYGITDGGIKRTGKSPKVLPRTVIYDPELTLDLPINVSVTSAMNAIAHAAEGLYAQDTNPLMDLTAQEGIATTADAIRRLRAMPCDVAARTDALYSAWLCGMVLGNVGMAWRSTISFAIPWAVASRCLTLKSTPSCCRTRSRSTLTPCRTR